MGEWSRFSGLGATQGKGQPTPRAQELTKTRSGESEAPYRGKHDRSPSRAAEYAALPIRVPIAIPIVTPFAALVGALMDKLEGGTSHEERIAQYQGALYEAKDFVNVGAITSIRTMAGVQATMNRFQKQLARVRLLAAGTRNVQVLDAVKKAGEGLAALKEETDALAADADTLRHNANLIESGGSGYEGPGSDTQLAVASSQSLIASLAPKIQELDPAVQAVHQFLFKAQVLAGRDAKTRQVQGKQAAQQALLERTAAGVAQTGGGMLTMGDLACYCNGRQGQSGMGSWQPKIRGGRRPRGVFGMGSVGPEQSSATYDAQRLDLREQAAKYELDVCLKAAGGRSDAVRACADRYQALMAAINNDRYASPSSAPPPRPAPRADAPFASTSYDAPAPASGGGFFDKFSAWWRLSNLPAVAPPSEGSSGPSGSTSTKPGLNPAPPVAYGSGAARAVSSDLSAAAKKFAYDYPTESACAGSALRKWAPNLGRCVDVSPKPPVVQGQRMAEPDISQAEADYLTQICAEEVAASRTAGNTNCAKITSFEYSLLAYQRGFVRSGGTYSAAAETDGGILSKVTKIFSAGGSQGPSPGVTQVQGPTAMDYSPPGKPGKAPASSSGFPWTEVAVAGGVAAGVGAILALASSLGSRR